jgi:hypothetical protein
MPDEALYRAEISRRCRRRMGGVYICLVAAMLFATGVVFSTAMMHGEGYSAATGTIVALGTGSSGEPTFTGEFTDSAGVVHRDTQNYGYHYARGEPRLGERVDYLYKTMPLGGEFRSFPRGDGFLRWAFGAPAAFFVLLAALFYWIIARERGFRLRLIREGKREHLEAARIRHRSVVVPTGANSHRVDLWRVEGRYFDPARGEYVDCHGDWESPPAPALPAGAAPLLLVDPTNSSRYWLPSAPLASV